MLKYSLIASLSFYTGVMFLIGFLSGIVAMTISLEDFTWLSPGLAFLGVFLAGFFSLLTKHGLEKRNVNGVVSVLCGILVRTTIVVAVIVMVVITQPKNVAFYVLCFSIVYYLGMIPVCAWLTIRSPEQPPAG